MDSFNEAWGIICDYCKERITDVAYKTWISKIEPVNLDFTQGKAILMVPGDFHRQTLIRGYMKLLNDAFANVFGPGIEITFTIPDEEPVKEQENPDAIMDADYEYTFDTFIVGSSNKFAHAASLAVATNPGKAYNPLFIYGNSGLGKTHLLYAIRNEIIRNDPNKTITYVKGDDFTNEFIESLQNATTSEFRQKYRKSDVLLVDDIQFIGGKERTQEEFFHTFNTLREANCQIVLTSDRPPKEIKTLEDRLRSRFESGLLADIQPPDYETRMAIIKRKAELLEFILPDDVTEYIATRLKTNIRQLEGAVIRLKALNHFAGSPITISMAQSVIRDVLTDEQPIPITVEKIISEVSTVYGISPEDIRSNKRAQQVSIARKVAIYVVREVTQMPLASIGTEFGGRDHSTIVYSVNNVTAAIEKDQNLRNLVNDIIKNIRDKSKS